VTKGSRCCEGRERIRGNSSRDQSSYQKSLGHRVVDSKLDVEELFAMIDGGSLGTSSRVYILDSLPGTNH